MPTMTARDDLRSMRADTDGCQYSPDPVSSRTASKFGSCPLRLIRVMSPVKSLRSEERICLETQSTQDGLTSPPLDKLVPSRGRAHCGLGLSHGVSTGRNVVIGSTPQERKTKPVCRQYVQRAQSNSPQLFGEMLVSISPNGKPVREKASQERGLPGIMGSVCACICSEGEAKKRGIRSGTGLRGFLGIVAFSVGKEA